MPNRQLSEGAQLAQDNNSRLSRGITAAAEREDRKKSRFEKPSFCGTSCSKSQELPTLGQRGPKIHLTIQSPASPSNRRFLILSYLAAPLHQHRRVSGWVVSQTAAGGPCPHIADPRRGSRSSGQTAPTRQHVLQRLADWALRAAPSVRLSGATDDAPRATARDARLLLRSESRAQRRWHRLW